MKFNQYFRKVNPLNGFFFSLNFPICNGDYYAEHTSNF